MNNFFKYRVFVFTGILIILITFYSGFYFGKSNQIENEKLALLLNRDNLATTTVDFGAFWKAWNIINDKYVPTNSTTTIEKVGDQQRVYGAIDGMVKSLGDPYTAFFPPVEAKNFSEQISGQIEGFGMEVGIKDGILTVIAPVKGTPAYRAGIKSGDQVLQIDGKPTSGLSTEEAIKFIRGPKGTIVKLTILPKGAKDTKTLSVQRDVINMPTVDTEVKGDVFVIRLYSFSAISPNLFRDALRQFLESGKYKMVIDLRGNPGGYLEAAQDMASWFLPAGSVIVKEDFRKAEDVQVFRSKGYNIFTDKLRLAVVIDGGSASASEILAGALHDHGIATLVGTQSFGKGSVQELIDITSNTSLKVTIAKWLTPNGISISHQGLTPDVVIKFDEKEFLKGNDVQLQKAIDVLNQ